MFVLFFLVAIIGLDVAAMRWGADSRDSGDWRADSDFLLARGMDPQQNHRW